MTMSTQAYYQNLWKKAYLIEIIHRNTQRLERSFAFSLPAETVSVEIPQRVNVTKTFGGVFIDDYGTDSAQITFSGSTGNTSIKRVYADGINVEMDGKSEAHYIIEEILQYKNTLQKYAEYEMRLYDLSSISESLIIDNMTFSNISVDGWIVVLREGKITRSKDKPLFYNYSMDFVGISYLGKKLYKKYSGDKTKGLDSFTPITWRLYPGERADYSIILASYSKPMAAVEANLRIAEGETNIMKTVLAGYNEVITGINDYQSKLTSFRSKAASYYRVVQGFLNKSVGTINTVFEIATFPYDMLADLVQSATAIRNTIEAILPTIINEWENLATKYGSINDMFASLFRVEDSTNNIAAIAKASGALPVVTMVPPGTPGATEASSPEDPGETPGIVGLVTYGDHETIVTSESSLETIAYDEYGTPEYASLIASYNGISGDSELEIGMVLRIPDLTPPTDLSENEVYSMADSVFGTDLALDVDGDITVKEYGDFGLVSLIGNISQAINLRIAESEGARVWIPAYGVRAKNGGYDTYSVAVLITSLKETLVRDPRIRSVYNVKGRIEGDALYIGLDVRLATGDSATIPVEL
jgi:hypothetical protein